jgi:hypothetical protein
MMLAFFMYDVECWNLWPQDEEQPEMDEAENNGATVWCHYHHPEEAPAQEGGFLPQEVLHQTDSRDTGMVTNCISFGIMMFLYLYVTL